MKRLSLIVCYFVFIVSSLSAAKTVYIPNEWRQTRTDTLLYKESDPDNKYTWSKSRSIESDNVIIFWDKYYGADGPKALSPSNFYYVDMDDLLQKCEAFFDLEIKQLGFVDANSSNLAKYKVMVLMNHTTTWTCYGGGYDFQVSALWLNPSTCKPVGQAVAHEVGHSFHYMCFAEHSGHQDSSTDNTGFHLACGNGQAIWEQTAQWQSMQSYPELMYDESIIVFRNSHNYAYSHEWHRYQSYWFHYFINQYYDDITTVAQVWNQPMTGQSNGKASDFNQALMALKNLSARDLYKMYFDYACRLATWDLDACKPYRNSYIGDYNYRCALTEDGDYQVALASCPQGTGFNVIPLTVPEAGTKVTTHLTGMPVASSLAEADPGEYLDGESQFTVRSTRSYVNPGNAYRSYRGFRMGYVALMQDGTRRYFSEDSVYCQGVKSVTEDYSFTVPEGVSQMWLVISPALKNYFTHKWDEDISGDDMWPYRFSLEGTDLTSKAIIYASPTLDGRTISDATFTYDITMPLQSTWQVGAIVNVTGRVAATLGTAFQVPLSDIASKLQTWSASGPANGKMMFYAADPDGSLAQSGSTANGYGHWFDADGKVCSYTESTASFYSEFLPSTLVFYIGQYPSRLTDGRSYTVRQAIKYRKSPREIAVATFVFNITPAATSSIALRSIDYDDPTVGIASVADGQVAMDNVYDLSGRNVKVNGNIHHSRLQKGIYVVNGKKVLIK